MKPLTIRTALAVTLDAALLLLCFFHVPSLTSNGQPPFNAEMHGGRVEVSSPIDAAAAGSLTTGDRILLWDGEPVLSDRDCEFFCDLSAAGEKATLTLEGGRQAIITCIPAYDDWYLIMMLVVGIVSWGLGVFVLLERPRELAASSLHWSLVSIGVSTMLTWGRIGGGGMMPLITRGVFFFVYMGVVSFFLFFTFIFPRPKPGPLWLKAVASFLPAFVLLPGLLVTHLRAIAEPSLPMYREFQGWFDAFHIVLIVYVVAGIFNIIHSYVTAETTIEKRKLQWIMWGLAIGPTPFLFLTVLPELFRPAPLIPEGVAELFFLFIPVAFAIAFVKYHVFDIQVVIKRTTVYAVVLGGVILMYSLVVGVVSAVVGAYTPAAGAAAAVGAALLFHPVRTRVQKWVDRKFFRVTYDFREAGKRILAEIGAAADERRLGILVIGRVDEIIPVERIGLFLASERGGVKAVEARGIEASGPPASLAPLARYCLEHASGLPLAVDGVVEAGVPHGTLERAFGGNQGIAAVFPMTEDDAHARGCIAVGPRRSGARFTAEDIDLMMQISAETGLAFQRIALEQRLLVEQAGARRLEELNRLKSDFVSYVSHELRTPLTSIKMFAEILRSPRMRLSRVARGHLRVIEGESERLGRMVTTILDSSRIEQGVKEYRPVTGDLRLHVVRALRTMTYQLDQHRFRWKLLKGRGPLPVNADPDAVVQAVVNLVANAIKYSGEKKELTVKVGKRNHRIFCSVRDRGRGIRADVLPRIFERFYRVPEAGKEVEGVGLGLPLVKHIMAAHNGSVEVSSVVGKGSTFTLLFPEPATAGTHDSRHRRSRHEHHSRHRRRSTDRAGN